MLLDAGIRRCVFRLLCTVMVLDTALIVRMMTHLLPAQHQVSGSTHGLSQYLETGCPNRGFIDFCMYKLWYKVHSANKINPIYLQILLF